MILELAVLASIWHNRPHHPPGFYNSVHAHPYLRVRLPECEQLMRYDHGHSTRVVHLNAGCTFNPFANRDQMLEMKNETLEDQTMDLAVAVAK